MELIPPHDYCACVWGGGHCGPRHRADSSHAAVKRAAQHQIAGGRTVGAGWSGPAWRTVSARQSVLVCPTTPTVSVGRETRQNSPLPTDNPYLRCGCDPPSTFLFQLIFRTCSRKQSPSLRATGNTQLTHLEPQVTPHPLNHRPIDTLTATGNPE